MKRLIVVLAIMMIVLSFSVNVYASNENSEEMEPPLTNRQYANAFVLYEYWETKGYLDYVGSVYSTDGSIENLTILLVNDDGTKEGQILSSLVDTSGVSFGTSKYSHNNLKSVHGDIERNYIGDDKNVYGVGIGWSSIDGVVTGFGEEGKESRVVVGVDKSVLTEYTHKFNKLYGDIVVVEKGEMSVLEEANSVNNVLENNDIHNNNSWLLYAFISIMIIGTIILMKNNIRRSFNEDRN